jgi:adenylate cyclase
MQGAVAGTRFGGRQLTFRIGINSGPVVAGIIGRKKFIYDLWGESVNLASRMESHGRARCIQITRSTYELVKDAFDCQAMGIIEVKGAGQMEV